jgi:hypothetical protein
MKSCANVIASISRCIGIACLLGLAACATPERISYPGYFVWIESDQLHSVMHQLASGVRRIDAAATAGGADSRAVIGGELDKMALVAERYLANRAIGSIEDLTATHLQFNSTFAEFLESLGQISARYVTDPNDYAVGNITGLCMACHGFR